MPARVAAIVLTQVCLELPWGSFQDDQAIKCCVCVLCVDWPQATLSLTTAGFAMSTCSLRDSSDNLSPTRAHGMI